MCVDTARMQVYGHVEKETEHEFVSLEQSTRHVPVNWQGDLVVQYLQTTL